MPRTPNLTAAVATLAPGSLTPGDHIFLDEVERLLHLALDRLGDVLEAIKPPTQYDAPAPHVPRDPEPSVFLPKPDFSFVPYAREFLRSVKGLQTICNLWAMLKTARTAGNADLPIGSPRNTDIPVCDSPSFGANPRLVAMVENLFKDDPKPTSQRP